jgi:RimJ/RimL family protein N-acetyltransferase
MSGSRLATFSEPILAIACHLTSDLRRSVPMTHFRYLRVEEWRNLREIRLRALSDSPETFLATFEREDNYNESEWQSEFERGDWIVGFADGEPVSLVGVTYAPKERKHYIEYMWVAPPHRESGVAKEMLDFVFAGLRNADVAEVFLWILDGNEPAALLYKKKGFAPTSRSHKLKAKPGRTEQQMKFELASRQETGSTAGSGTLATRR